MALIAEFARTKTKTEIQERGLRDRLLVCPVNDLRDVLDSPQLEARDFWDVVDGTEIPGAHRRRLVHAAAGAGPGAAARGAPGRPRS